MNRVIRKAIFETNSSSTHSITIVGGSYVPHLWKPLGGRIEVLPGEFGWEEETYRDPWTKASYCLVWAKTCSSAQERHMEMLEKALKEGTGAEDVEFVQEGGHYPWGYIDHQSNDVCAEAFESGRSLFDFIFNDLSELRTDNDNR